jgi:hypothetical protein
MLCKEPVTYSRWHLIHAVAAFEHLRFKTIFQPFPLTD